MLDSVINLFTFFNEDETFMIGSFRIKKSKFIPRFNINQALVNKQRLGGRDISNPVVSPEASSWEHMFRAYDIRGIYGKDLTTQIAEIIGRGFGTFIGSGKKLAVARDIRIGSEQLKKAVVGGLISTGCDVVDFGITTTPMFYFAIAHQNKDGGVMATASHNPPEWNGFKLCREKGIIVGQGFGMDKVKDIIAKRRFTKASVKGKIKIYKGIVDEYADFVLGRINVKKRLKVVLDTGNSVPGIVAPMLFRRIGCKVEVLNEKLDGTFPSRSPEPTEASLQQLIREVKKTRADLGVGYDADGDRAVFVDDKGR
ncbi:MAG: hypothetical protein OEY30_02825, partial [Candidatus Bathyarchaeota archaeon]|nr:hypothetical protein [Candidatus Bathyarchaeota archaeon]